MKRILALIPLLSLFLSSAFCQSIQIVRFDNTLPYAPGSGVSVHFTPTLFKIGNIFSLQLSDASGSFASPVTIATATDFFLPVLNGIIPASTPPGNNYRLRIVGSSGNIISTPTGAFSVIAGTPLATPSIETVYPGTMPVKCIANSNVFGYLDMETGASSLVMGFDIKDYNASVFYTINLINSSGTIMSVLSNNDQNVEINSLPIGYYIVELIKKSNGISTVFSYIVLVERNGTGLINLSSEQVCTGSQVQFKIDGINNNYPGSKYTISYGDGSPVETYTHDSLMTNPFLSHIFTTPTCNSISSIPDPNNNNNRAFAVDLQLYNKGLSPNCTDYISNSQKKSFVNASTPPVADFTIPSSVCQNSVITANNTSIGGYYGSGSVCLRDFVSTWQYKKPSGTVYTNAPSSWINSTTGNLTIPASAVTEAGCWMLKLQVQNPKGCPTISVKEKTIGVEIPPTPNFSLNPSTICTGQSVQVTDLSGAQSLPCQNPVYSWKVTPATGFTPAILTGPSPLITFTTGGVYTIVQTITNSCGMKLSAPQTVTVNGAPTVSFPSGANLCKTGPLDEVIDFYQGPYKPTYSSSPFAPTSYQWTVNGDPADYDFITSNNVDYPKIRFKTFRCYDISVTVNGNCNPPNSKSVQLCFKQSPQITNNPLLATICSGGTTAALSLTSDMPGAVFGWQAIYSGVTPSSPLTGTASIPAQTFAVTGTAPGKITYTLQGAINGCTGPSKDYTVTVTPSIAATIEYETPLCNTIATATATIKGTFGGSFTGDAGLVIDAVTGAISPSLSTPGTHIITYSINPSPPCPGLTTTATVVINQGNSSSAGISYPSDLCNVANTTNTPNPLVSVVQTGTPGGIYSILPSTGLPIDAGTGTITPAGAKAGSYIVTYSIANTAGCADYKVTASITIHEATAAQISYAGPFCSSVSSATVTRSGSAGGLYSSTSGLSIDPASGTINPASSISGTYTISYNIAASAPCPAAMATAIVTITQAPTAIISYPGTLCNVSNTVSNPNPPVPVTQIGSTGGTYSISPSTGLLLNPATGTLDPSGATAGTYKITYTIAASGGCGSYTTSATVNVSSTPVATIQYASPVCSYIASAPVTKTGNGGGTYTATPAGLIIDPATGTINAQQSIPGIYEVTYTIAASVPCPGVTTTTEVIITQAPSATISYPAVLCNVANTALTPNLPVPVTRSGSIGGNYSIFPSTGLSIDPLNGVLTPSGATAGIYTITYAIAAGNGCPVYITTATVTVNSTPIAGISYNSPVCSSAGSAPINRTGNAGGSYTAPSGLDIDAISGTIHPQLSTPGTYEVIYTIAASAPCPGTTAKTLVTITRAPAATISYPLTLCNIANTASTPNPPVNATQTGDPGGMYSIVPVTGLPINVSTGLVTPSGATPGTYTITYTIPAANGCPVFTTAAIVTVNSAPQASIIYPASPYCNGLSQIQPVTRTGSTGGVYSSTAGLSIDPTTGAINPSLSMPGTYTVTYTITPVAPCFVFSTSTTVTITEAPVISFTAPVQTICSGETAIFKVLSSLPGTNLTWAVAGPLSIGVAGISSGSVLSPATDIKLSFTNTGTTGQTISINVIPVNPAQNPCAGAPFVIKLTVNPIPSIPVISDTLSYCQASPASALAAVASPGNHLLWYDQNMQVLPAAPVPQTALPALFTYYVSQANAYNCESPKKKVIVIISQTPSISFSGIKDPTDCGTPSGAITVTVKDLSGTSPLTNAVFEIYYNKDLSANVSGPLIASTNAAGELSIPLTAGTYSNIKITLKGCSSNIIAGPYTLKDPTPPGKPTAGYTANLCSNDTLRLTALSVPGALGNGTPNGSVPVAYVWAGPAFGNGNYVTSSSTLVLAPPLDQKAGFYVVYAMQGNCRSVETSFTVTVKQAPSKPIVITRNPLCVGDVLNLQANSSMPGNNPQINYTWTGPGLGSPIHSQNTTIGRVAINDAGLYTITANAPATGCNSQTDTLISIGNYPIVDLGASPLTLSTGTRYTLLPKILNANIDKVLPIKSYVWTPAKDIQCYGAGCDSAVAIVKNNICYQVKATNIYGCSDTASICINAFCKNSQVFIPNAFTPDGDKLNDVFMIRATGIVSVKSLRIFSRWGELVFEKYNFAPNAPENGWDGSIKGKIGPPAVYVYMAEVVCENGNSFTYQGNVTLLK